MHKLVLLAHRDQVVRDRFASAVTDAHHRAVLAGTAADAVAAAAQRNPAVSLAVLDLRLHDDPVRWIRHIRSAGHSALPVLIFARTVGDAGTVRMLLPVAVAGYISDDAAPAQILPALAPHLFPSSFDRRLSPRQVLSVPVSYRSGATIAGAVTLNVGRGGLAIRTLTPLPVGADIVVKFRLPSAGADTERRGQVVWADQRVGMGVQFTEELETAI